MFRNPRENATVSIETPVKPATGRPPTPPHSGSTTRSIPTPVTQSAGSKLTGAPNKLGNRSFNMSAKVSKVTGGKANGSILNFFTKASCRAEEGLFLSDGPNGTSPSKAGAERSRRDYEWDDAETLDHSPSRFNEDASPAKRRKTEDGEAVAETKSATVKSRGGIFLDSDDEEVEPTVEAKAEETVSNTIEAKIQVSPIEIKELKDVVPKFALDAESSILQPRKKSDTPKEEEPKAEDVAVAAAEQNMPLLKREPTSFTQEDDEFGGEDFDEDLFLEGDEYMERQLMEQEAQFEADCEDQSMDGASIEIEQEVTITESAPCCPICNSSLSEVSSEIATRHVNSCLDGNPTPLPIKAPETKPTKPLSTNRFVRPAKPGQANPFAASSKTGGPSTAFSKIMASHTEDAAWASAAAAENASRGKFSYERTCPFYKILPGFNICVDAFRYGAVQGCNAYFLSHFHSDHYIGLTSSWQNGPIYCSRVTANLVRRQLRVDPRYVVDLEFEERTLVPGTNGVEVIMIPANHCPGSSLFLFEKVLSSGKTSKKQRVLHCGDFRACPAHIQHPLLRPNLLDKVTGKSEGQQRIDVCYLDTTYLNPRYAFPSQEDVIGACADMCVSLKKERVDADDAWETTKRDRAGSGMAKFVRKESGNVKPEEAADEDTVNAMAITNGQSDKERGRLLVVVGTYSIGKERICVGIAKKLGSKIYAPPSKQRICSCLEDPELNSLLTTNPREGQVHMTPLSEIRAETLSDYLKAFKPHFSRVVGFRPSGWNYRPPNSRFVESPSVSTVLHSANWKSTYSMGALVPQRGSTREASCFGVPYSEHSSFRELTMFCCALRIDKVIPTVNIGSAKSREKMKGWVEKWATERKKNGLFKVEDGQAAW